MNDLNLVFTVYDELRKENHVESDLNTLVNWNQQDTSNFLNIERFLGEQRIFESGKQYKRVSKLF